VFFLSTDILRTIQSAEDTTVYDQVVATIFDDERVTANAERISRGGTKLKSTLSSVKVIGVQDRVLDCVKDVFMRHGASPIECASISLLDNPHQLNRLAVRLVDQSGNMLHLRYDTRQHFAYWVAQNQHL
jgi:translation initiation factor 2-alpha kinase 4